MYCTEIIIVLNVIYFEDKTKLHLNKTLSSITVSQNVIPSYRSFCIVKSLKKRSYKFPNPQIQFSIMYSHLIVENGSR